MKSPRGTFTLPDEEGFWILAAVVAAGFILSCIEVIDRRHADIQASLGHDVGFINY